MAKDLEGEELEKWQADSRAFKKRYPGYYEDIDAPEYRRRRPGQGNLTPGLSMWEGITVILVMVAILVAVFLLLASL